MNDKDRENRLLYESGMRVFLAILGWLLLTAAASPITSGPFRLCDDAQGRSCRTIGVTELRLDRPENFVERNVRVDPAALPLDRPLMVWITAMASSEVRWNGVLVGSNGRPGPDRASEQPGRFSASIPVPASLVRPGDNRLSVRLSAHRLWLPVQRPVHFVEVSPYETPTLFGLSHYLPAMLCLGALAAALAYFGAAAWSDRQDRQARLIALIAATTMAQLVVEVLRSFANYAYPWHLPRVAAIALLAGITAVLTASYAARRFAPHWQPRASRIAAFFVLASLILVPWYDLKAMGAILAGAAALAACAASGLRRRIPGAGVGLAGAVMVPALIAWQLTDFLDQSYYLLVAVLLIALIAEQVAQLRAARRRRDSEAARAQALEERLRRAGEAGEAIAELKDGSRIHRVVAGDIIFVQAADDYAEVTLADGRRILVTMTLSRLLETLPGCFLRVHKSYAVNLARVASLDPRPGGGRLLRLDQGSRVPVGRSYGAALANLREAG